MSDQPVIAVAVSEASLPCASQRGLSNCPGAICELPQPMEQPHMSSVPCIIHFWTLRACSSRQQLSSCTGWPQCCAVFLDAYGHRGD